MIEIYSGDYIDIDLAYLQANPEYKLGDDGLIWAFLDQIANSENATWKLKEWSAVSQNPNFNAKAITWMQTAGFNIYRIRPLSQRLQKYRILYAYNARRDEVYLLAIVIKPPLSGIQVPINEGYEYYDYEQNHRITARIFSEYNELNLPKLH